MLIWQDLPLQWGYARSVGKQAARQAAEAVDLLGHHPSVAIWCGHNEPLTLDMRPGEPVASRRTAIEFVVAARSCRAGTGRSSTPASSGPSSGPTAPGRSSPTPASPPTSRSSTAPTATSTSAGTTVEERDLPGFAAAWPRMVRFVSEFGAQAVPADASFMEPERWPDLDWERLQAHHALQKVVFDERVPPADHDTFAAGRRRRSATRPASSATTSRRCAA